MTAFVLQIRLGKCDGFFLQIRLGNRDGFFFVAENGVIGFYVPWSLKSDHVWAGGGSPENATGFLENQSRFCIRN